MEEVEAQEWRRWLSEEGSSYWLTRFFLLRLLGLIYAVAFLVAANQIVPLIGTHGLLPLPLFMERVREVFGSSLGAFLHLPSLFWFFHSDRALVVVAWIGAALSIVVLAGYANAILLAILWFLYMSLVHVGQDWYGYGWEVQLLETGFLAIFLCPLLDARPFPRRPPPLVVIWLFRALVFRIMLGAGLIKIRGDASWRNLTALYYHFETQPLPNPLSRWFYFLPHPLLRVGTLFNHIAELAAPWFVFWPRMARGIAGLIIIAFQIVIILSGNLAFLNWLTIVPALACFDDAMWARIVPRALANRAQHAAAAAVESKPMKATAWTIAALIALLSLQPLLNMFSSHQIMNTSYDRLDLVNTYGAFGSVGKERFNIVFEGTDSYFPDETAKWKPYLYKGLPVALDCRPPQVAPYQLRLDWQMWFAAMGTPNEYPWTLNLIWKLLHNDAATLSLFANNPFPQHPPRYVRAVWYRYRFARPDNKEGLWWRRDQKQIWLPPLSVDNAELVRFLHRAGWLPQEAAR